METEIFENFWRDFKKVKRVYESCKTPMHVRIADRYCDLFVILHRPGSIIWSYEEQMRLKELNKYRSDAYPRLLNFVFLKAL